MDKVVALIPLRGGSKSIPKKNIKYIAGKPLCAWVIDSAIDANVFDKVYISTDSEEIVQVVKSLCKNVEIIMRPPELATDAASTESVIDHFMKLVDFEVLVTIQATSPLVCADDFKAALTKFRQQGIDSMLTGVRFKRFIWTSEGFPLNYNPAERPMRQHFDGSIMENGAFYITSRKIIEEQGSRLGGKIGIYEMPEETGVEIDEPEDWKIVESLLLKNRNSIFSDRLKKIKLLAFDCDGVLTDSGMYYSESGDEFKKFNTRDGLGVELMRNINIRTAIITGESSKSVTKRAEKLRIDDLFLGTKDKASPMQELMEKYELNNEQIAYIGDDLGDLPAIELAGMSFAPSDAVEEVKASADYVLKSRGGAGVLREVCDLIMRCQQVLC